MKKALALILAMLMALSLVACGGSAPKEEAPKDEPKTEDTAPTEGEEADETAQAEEGAAPVEAAAGDFKVGVVLVGDENEGYTAAHINGIKEAAAELGMTDDQIIWKYCVPEDETCYDACVDLADAGCKLIITNSYGHQSYCSQAAGEFPDVQFVADTGDTANQLGMANFHNAFTNIYEARYVSGVVAGMKVAQLVEEGKLTDANMKDGKVKIGYVGAYPYAEVVSGYTAFFLGIQSIYPDVTMEVQYTNSWFDLTAEAEAANALMADGCVIIGQHADSTGAPSAVQAALDKGTVAYSVGYNIDMLAVAPTAALTSATNNWGVFYKYAFETVMNGGELATDWSEGLKTDAVGITELGESCAPGTAEKVAEVEDGIKNGTINVFDCSTFTVGGENPTSILIDMDGDFTGETEGVVDGVFEESVLRSAPGFTARIDGITELN